MGTQHGYTHKECKVCKLTKAREDFPAYGGLTCRECMRKKENAESADRYQREKQNPKWVEQNRQRARDYKRKKKQEREQNVPEPPPSDDGNVSDDDVPEVTIDEFLDGLAGGDRLAHDDDMVELTGSGLDVQTPGDPDEQRLADALSAWRDRIQRKVPLDPLPTETGADVSIQENAQKLRAIAGRTAVAGAVQQAAQQLSEDQNEAVLAADPSGASADAVALSGAFEAAKQALEDAMGVVRAAYEQAGAIAGQHGA